MSKLKIYAILFFIFAGLAVLQYRGKLKDLLPSFSKSMYDKPDKKNDKLVYLFNAEIEAQIKSYAWKPSKSEEFDSLAKASKIPAQKKLYEKFSKDFDKPVFATPYTKYAQKNAELFFQSINSIESYARFGVMSNKPHNLLELTINFADGRASTEVYTGRSIYGTTGPNVLFKVILQDGQVIQAFSNGVELKNPPDWAKADIQNIIKSCLFFDATINPANYYKAGKTKTEINEDWEKVGEK